MPTPDEIHAEMAQGYAQQRPVPLPVNLSPDLAAQLRHYMASRSLTAEQALQIIISRFFNSTHG